MSPSTTNAKKQEARILPKDYIPGDNTVIICRGKRCITHEGNKRFRNIVKSELRGYVSTNNKIEKSVILLGVIRQVRKNNNDGIGFVKQDLSTGRWYELTEFASRVSAAQAFRDANSSGYKSSKQSKQKRRRMERLSSIIKKAPELEDRITVANSIRESVRPILPKSTSSSVGAEMTQPFAMVRASLNIPPRPMREVLSCACDLIETFDCSHHEDAGMPLMDTPSHGYSRQMSMNPAMMMNSNVMAPQMTTMPHLMNSSCGVPPQDMSLNNMMAPGLFPFRSNQVSMDPLPKEASLVTKPLMVALDDFEDDQDDEDDFLDVFHAISLPNLKAALKA
ncbi:Nitrilase family, member 2 [Seminavis robusta]|uniref:Nitrilase family, member 2 n=1 Tax=Seminavis robusta TaxID=568900 RepID=A0A9N8EGB8_9STRA|nr:Nitrilase family, member 2 [Seminavis robusta]|eukprot:Sro959_g224760.1 Nitrilase family, member 2 (336) ;mRNA; f:18268-19275